MAPASTSLQVTRETLSSRAGATVLFQFSSNWQPRCGTWSGTWLTLLFVTRMEVPRLTVPSTRGAGEEVNSPAGGARGDGGDVGGGVSIFRRLFEEGNWGLFLGGAFVEYGDTPLIMAGARSKQESES